MPMNVINDMVKRYGKKKRWIQGMHMKAGALHRQMGVPMSKNIPVKKLDVASGKSGLLGERARLALRLKGFNH